MAGVGAVSARALVLVVLASRLPDLTLTHFPGISGGLRDGILLEFGYVLAPSNWHWHARLRRGAHCIRVSNITTPTPLARENVNSI